MRLALLTHDTGWHTIQLAESAARAGYEVQLVAYAQLADEVGPVGKGRQTSWDAVLVRSMPRGSLEEIIFRMDWLARLERHGTIVANPARALETAIDKYLCLTKLADAGLATPPTVVCQSVERAASAFDELGGDVVLKPLFGSQGRGMIRLRRRDEVGRAAATLVALGQVIYLQAFVEHDAPDVRVLVIGDQAWGVTRENRHDWRSNVARGSACRVFDDEAVIELGKRAAAAIGAPIAGVDLVPTNDGRWLVLEVNSVPGWRGLESAWKINVADAVVRYVGGLVSARSRSS